MSEEPVAGDLTDLVRRSFEAVNRRDLDAVMSFCPPDGVDDVSPSGLGVFEGPAVTTYWGLGEGRAAAERLAEARG